MRVRLGKQIKDFLNAASSFLPTLEEADLKGFEDESIDTPKDESVETDDPLEDPADEDDNLDEEDESESPSILPEAVVLPLPSNITETLPRVYLLGGERAAKRPSKQCIGGC